MDFWVETSAEDFTARCERELAGMKSRAAEIRLKGPVRRDFSSFTITEVRRDFTGCPPPERRLRPREDSRVQDASGHGRAMGAVFDVQGDDFEVTVRAHMESA